jgi:hypothetical protein
MFTDWYRFDTHLITTGGTGFGKSSLSEDCRRDRLRHRDGYLSAMSGEDPKTGMSVYERHMNYLRYLNPEKRVIGIDLSHPDAVIPCNWFSNLQGEEIGAHSSRLAMAVAGAWGVKNLNEMMTYARVMKTVVGWCVESGQPIQRAVEWLDFGRTELQEKALRMAKSDRVKREIHRIMTAQRNEWNSTVLSTLNRLDESVNSLALRRFTATEGALDIPAEVRAGSIICVNITPNANLGWEAVSVFMALLVSELLRARGRYFVDLDEVEHYLSFDTVRLLDVGRGNGIRFSLICHNEGQFDDERVTTSVDVNCGIKVVFGGMNYWNRRRIAPELFAKELNMRRIKETYRGYEQVPEWYQTDTFSETEGEFPSSTSGTSYGTRYVPGERNVVTGRAEYSLEEKTSMAAELLSTPRGVYHVKLPSGTFKRRVHYVRPFLPSARGVVEFEKSQGAGPGAMGADLADRLQNESRLKFLGDNHVRPDRRKKDSRTLSS